MKDAQFLRLKAGATDLVDMCGGQKRSGEIVDVSQQRVSKIVQRGDDAMFSLRATLALELECGEPVLTRVMAELQGFRLEREGPPPTSEGCIHGAHAAIMIEIADFCRAFGEAWRDRDYSRTDAAHVDRELTDLIRMAEAFRRINAAEMAKGCGE